MERPFDKRWMLVAMGTFIGIELILGGLVGEFLIGRYSSISLKFTLQGLLNIVSYFIGGLLIGFFSPGLRVREPAVGAFLSVALMLSLSFFTPYGFIHFSFIKMIIGGAIAFWLAMVGARFGERLAGNRVPD